MSPTPTHVTSVPAPPPDTVTPQRTYDGTSPFPPNGPTPARDGGERLYVAVTAVIVILRRSAWPAGCCGAV
jgi:stearoyl-CoA desaturase (Delta-9 desaturase)